MTFSRSLIVWSMFGLASQTAVFAFQGPLPHVHPTMKSQPGFSPTAIASTVPDAQDSMTIDQDRRSLMNLIVLGSGLVTLTGMGIPYFAFFYPPSPATGVGGSILAKDKNGVDIVAADYLASKPAGDRSLVQGFRGDATYLIVKEDKTLESYALNAICTHLGCVVPWSEADNKFICPCHASQYSPDGTVIRGPAPLPLELAHVHVQNNAGGNVEFLPWTEDDFRTGQKAWWI